jgi:hypothetical protein
METRDWHWQWDSIEFIEVSVCHLEGVRLLCQILSETDGHI